MTDHYIERKLGLKLSDRDLEVLNTLDIDIIKFCTDRVAIRADVTNKLAFIIATARECRKEATPYGTFIVNGLQRIKIDSIERQHAILDEDTSEPESSYQPQGRSYSRPIVMEQARSSRFTPQEQSERLNRAKERYALYQELKRLHKEKVEMRPVELEPFELVRNPDYVDRGEPKSSIQRCVERLNS